MFLYAPLQSAKSSFPSKGTNPTSLNWFDFSCPVKTVNGPTSGPIMVSSFLESIYFRKGTPKKMTEAAINAYIASAQAKDKALEDSGAIEDFIASDDGYVTLENYLNALADDHKYIKGTIEWATDVNMLKWQLHRYKCAIVETYLLKAFTSNPSGFDISTLNYETKALRKDYTKSWIAFGYTDSSILVLNSLGPSWGKLGFVQISWSILNGNVVVGDENEQRRCFIKSAAFKGCFN